MAQLVRVRRRWTDNYSGVVGIEDLEAPQRSSFVNSGGWKVWSPFPLLCCYVYCDRVMGIHRIHSCSHGTPPHKIKVVVLAADNLDTYHAIALRARESMTTDAVLEVATQLRLGQREAVTALTALAG